MRHFGRKLTHNYLKILPNMTQHCVTTRMDTLQIESCNILILLNKNKIQEMRHHLTHQWVISRTVRVFTCGLSPAQGGRFQVKDGSAT
jgi:hypothetical protein